VPACLRALRDDQITAGVDGAPRVSDLAAHVDHQDAVTVTQINDGTWNPQPGDEYPGALGDDLFDLPAEVTRQPRRQGSCCYRALKG
jgi:hypothetical protein